MNRIERAIRDICEFDELPALDDPERLVLTVSDLRVVLERYFPEAIAEEEK